MREGSRFAALLKRAALDRPETRAWALYDWANSAFWAVVVAAIFPIYFRSVAAADLPGELPTQRYAVATTIGLAIVAVLAPILGALADYTGGRKRGLALFAGFGITAVAAMFTIERGDWLLASVLLILSNIGVNGSFVFYDALLPHVARPEETDRLSSAGYALGYLGSGLLLAANVAWILKPQWFGLPHGEGLTPSQATLPTRLAFLSVAIWWAVFSIPLLRRVPEPPALYEPDERRGDNPVRVAFTRLGETFKELRLQRDAFLFLLAFLIYNDGIGTVIRMAAIYGAEIGIPQSSLILSILLVQFVGVPFSLLFGALAGRIGPKPAILIGLAAYAGISLVAFYMKTATHFLVLALLVGMVQGGTQALSRSLFASMIPKHKSAEFFGFFAVFEKFAGIFGPALVAVIISATGSTRLSILSVVVFFVVGAALLIPVDIEAGRRRAREAERELRAEV
jgi:UMF1 family MFS transporter